LPWAGAAIDDLVALMALTSAAEQPEQWLMPRRGRLVKVRRRQLKEDD